LLWCKFNLKGAVLVDCNVAMCTATGIVTNLH